MASLNRSEEQDRDTQLLDTSSEGQFFRTPGCTGGVEVSYEEVSTVLSEEKEISVSDHIWIFKSS